MKGRGWGGGTLHLFLVTRLVLTTLPSKFFDRELSMRVDSFFLLDNFLIFSYSFVNCVISSIGNFFKVKVLLLSLLLIFLTQNYDFQRNPFTHGVKFLNVKLT
jgi:hypothetical protein